MRIVVVGGNVVGLTTAAMLKRLGFNYVTVLDRGTVPDLSIPSPPVFLASTAAASLRFLQLEGALVGANINAIEVYGEKVPLPDQEVTSIKPTLRLPQTATASSYVSTVREEHTTYEYGNVPALALASEAVLRHRLSTYCSDVRYDTTVLSVACDSDGAYISLRDGSREFADVVIVTEHEDRNLLPSAEGTELPIDTLAIRGGSDKPIDPNEVLTAVISMAGPNTMVKAGDKWSVVAAPPSAPITSVPDTLEYVKALFSEETDLISRTAPTTVEFQSLSMATPPLFYSGRIVAVGRGAYDLPHGLDVTCGIEDAITLTHAMKDRNLDTSEVWDFVFQHYIEMRMERFKALHHAYSGTHLLRTFGTMPRIPVAVPWAIHRLTNNLVADCLSWRYDPRTMNLLAIPFQAENGSL
eukprot:PhM_4_TR7972/c0_g1_i1/m.103625